MNWDQLKDPVSHICHAGVALPFIVMTNISITEFNENIQGKLKYDVDAKTRHRD